MSIEIKVPSPGESITEVELVSWLVEDGDYVELDQEIAEIDSDKATLSISATTSGAIKILVPEGETIEVGSVVATIDEKAEGRRKKAEGRSQKAEGRSQKAELEEKQEVSAKEEQAAPTQDSSLTTQNYEAHYSPLAKKIMQEQNISEAEFMEFFKHLRFGKKDVEFYLKEKGNVPNAIAKAPASETHAVLWDGDRESETKKLTTLRKKLAQRLVSVKNETAMLTTFNEVNMTPIMDIRKKYKDIFKEQHGIGLGFMSFFTRAVTIALQHYPQINSQLDGDELITFKYADIGIAVSAPKGLMVPVIRNAEKLSLAEIEKTIKELAIKARDNKITLDEMAGGTFTITNGGVFGSMLSTPIINPPQSAILGMHNIVERPIAVNGKVEVHPVMYVALSYDHRVVDGKESVSFLKMVKDGLENPALLMTNGKDPLEMLLNL